MLAPFMQKARAYCLANATTYQPMTAQAMADALNALVTAYGRLSVAAAMDELTARGKALNMATFMAGTDTASQPLRTYLDMLLNGQQTDFNPFDASATALFEAMQSAGILDSEDVASLKALATTTTTLAQTECGLDRPMTLEWATAIREDLKWL